MKLSYLPIALVSALSAGCAPPSEDLAERPSPSRAALAIAPRGPITIAGVIDRQSSTLGQHGWELYGAFDGFALLRPEVRCNGALVTARVAYASAGQMNVFHVEQPSGATCTVALERLTDGVRSNTWAGMRPAPAIEIRSMEDAGAIDGRRIVDLAGTFGGPVAPRVLCDGVTVAARTEAQSYPWQSARVSWPDAGAASRCALVLRQTATNMETPLFGHLPMSAGVAMTGVGAYHWGGASLPSGATDILASGQRSLAVAGFDTARFVFDPIERSGGPSDWYRLGASFCAGGATKYLPCVMRSKALASALAPASIRTVLFSAYDETSRDHFTDAAWVQANAQAIHDEYYDAAMALFAGQAGSGRTFVFANWETDNTIYCGSAYRYAQDTLRLGRPPASCANGSSPGAALAGVIAWFAIRNRAIADARAAAGPGVGVTVADGIELNSVHMLQDLGLPSALGDVIPRVGPAFALYSSYDSQFPGTYEEDLASLEARLGATQLLIGETGFSQHGIDGVEAFRTVEQAKAIQRAGIRASILWEAFDTAGAPCGDGSDPNDVGCVHPMGVLEADGSDRLVSRMLRAALAAQARALASPHVASIAGIRVRDLVAEPRGPGRYYELYGSFPGGPYSPVVTCDGTDARAEISGTPTVGQINVRIAHDPSTTRWCVFRVVRPDGRSTLDFGPKLDRQ